MGAPPLAEPSATVFLLGVAFTWPRGQEPSTGEIHEGVLTVTNPIESRFADAICRQKRSQITYVDAMSLICEGEPAHLKHDDAFGIAGELSLAIGDGLVPDHLFLQLARFEPLSALKQSFRFAGCEEDQASIIAPSIQLEDFATAGTGRDGLGEGSVRRHLEIPLRNAVKDTDWHLLSIYAVLAHLKCDLEVMLDTAFLPVRRCQRHRCSAFYRVKRMSGRSRFCSDTCRACAAREQPS